MTTATSSHLSYQKKEIDYQSKNKILESSQQQDKWQRIQVVLSLALESYRSVMGCCLLLFVSQKCNDHICSLFENIFQFSMMYKIGYILNLLTLCSMAVLYYFEIIRENGFIEYLEVDSTKSNDTGSVRKELKAMCADHHNYIIQIDNNFKFISKYVIIITAANILYSSWLILAYHYLDIRTVTTLVTNIIFISTKLISVYVTVFSEDYIFYSSYLKKKTQFNTVDPDKRVDEIDTHALFSIMDEVDRTPPSPPKRSKFISFFQFSLGRGANDDGLYTNL